MASITAHPGIRPRRSTAVVAEVPPEENHQPTNPVPGPDEGSLARTTAVVTTSLALLIGLVVAVAYGAGSVVGALASWVLG
jgi:hypothetical protein